jgi:ubiquitin carboxyl-terminal hydrolase 10
VTAGVTPSETVQPFTMLHLDIQSDNVHSVEDALRLLTAPEKVFGYRAKGSATEVDATKTVQLLDLPQVSDINVCDM